MDEEILAWIEADEGIDDLGRRRERRHVMPRVRDHAGREPVAREHLGQPCDEGFGLLGNRFPTELGEPRCEECSQKAPWAGRPLDVSFVDVLPPRRGMVAPAREAKSDRRHRVP